MKQLLQHIHLYTSYTLLLVTGLLAQYSVCTAQDDAGKEEDYFKIMKVPAPEGIILEVGGICTLPNGSLGVATRRGDVFIVENPGSQRPYFRKFAGGLHEVLGLEYKNGSLYCAQRGELTKLTDTNMDGRADEFETIYAWPLSGNYHEYSFGPKMAPDGSFFVTLNLGFLQDWWHAKSIVPWRGWALRIFEDGRMEPWAAGLRSPCGISMIDGEPYYTDNQGDWVGSGSIKPLKKGAFMGHPASLVWTNQSNSPLQLTQQQFFTKNNNRVEFDPQGKPVKPQNIEKEMFNTEAGMKQNFPEIQIPLVWLPHGILGVSSSEIVRIPQGSFGPFEGQLLVCDQGQSKIDRVFMEKVNGEYQGVAWDFRSGFQSGIVRLTWSRDGSLFAGETNRGWGSAGEATMGLQRLVWNSKIPFEMKAVRAMPDGFEIEFTKPANKKTTSDLASYSVESFTYKYQAVYGSPNVNNQKCAVKGVKVSEDGLKARIIVSNLRKNYIHTISLNGIIDQESSFKLVHPVAYYTLNNIPAGNSLTVKEVSTFNSAAKAVAGTTAKKPVTIASSKPVTYIDVSAILRKNTCLACHNTDKRQVGPSFKEIAKRNYTTAQILELVRNPKPEHWPDYSTPMPPMPQVPKADIVKISEWMKTLK